MELKLLPLDSFVNPTFFSIPTALMDINVSPYRIRLLNG